MRLALLVLAPAGARCFLDSLEHNISPLQYGNTTTAFAGSRGDLDPSIGSTSMNTPLGGLGDIVRRQRSQCPAGYISCGDGIWCHRPGTNCCPRDHSISCPIGNTCCNSGCARTGQQCCPGQRYTCPTGKTCCPGGHGCAHAGETCCGDTVCLANEKCCDNNHCAPKTATCCGAGYCEDVGATCCGGIGCAKAGMVCCGAGLKGACPRGETCCSDQMGLYCGRNGCLPTLKFPNVKGTTDEVAENICKGLKDYFKKNGHVEFTWNGPGRANRRITRRNRRASGCGGGLVCPAGYNCDEFPLASTAEGGRGATISCVPIWLNGFYGYVWNIWRISQLKSGFARGSAFRIIMDGCDFTGLTKRSEIDSRAANEIVLSSHDDVIVFDGSFIGNGTEGNNVVLVPLTQHAGNPGMYTLNYTLKEGESITSGWIMDEDGEVYETLGELKSGSSNTTTFELEDADDSPVYFFEWTKATDVQIDVSIKTPPRTTSTTSMTPKPTVSETTSQSLVPTTTRNSARVKLIYEGLREGVWVVSWTVAVLLI